MIVSERKSLIGRCVIACFKPKSGCSAGLNLVIQKHWMTLHGLNLVTDRKPYVMQGLDGTIVDVFEWQSTDAIQIAHEHPVVQALWNEFEAVCDYVPLSNLPETGRLFPEFEPLPLDETVVASHQAGNH